MGRQAAANKQWDCVGLSEGETINTCFSHFHSPTHLSVSIGFDRRRFDPPPGGMLAAK